jgi:hypothetical protein
VADKQARLIQAMNRAAEEVFAELVTPSPAGQGEPDLAEDFPRRANPAQVRFNQGRPCGPSAGSSPGSRARA